MFCENLKTIRKQRGLSQDALAMRLHVVRQTISKWENGISVPDATQLIQLAEVLDTSVEDLLGSPVTKEHELDLGDLARELSLLNAQMAVRNRRTKKILKACLIGLCVLAGFIGFLLLWNVAG